MKRQILPKELSNREFEVVEWRVIAVWNDGLVEDWSKTLADDSTLAIEVESYCQDYAELRNQFAEDEDGDEEYKSTEW